jgi:hypothetical protein
MMVCLCVCSFSRYWLITNAPYAIVASGVLYTSPNFKQTSKFNKFLVDFNAWMAAPAQKNAVNGSPKHILSLT